MICNDFDVYGNMSGQISILAGLKNNLDYTKKFYYTTRDLYPEAEIVFVSHNSTDGTHEWLDSLTDINLIYYYDAFERTFSDTFNKCTELATKEYVLFAHNDMILAPLFLENVEKLLRGDRVVVYSTIEPPIFSDHERDGKIVRDFGIDTESVDVPAIYAFAEEYRERHQTKSIEVEKGAFFMCLHRAHLLNIGGLDPLYSPMFREDDDLLIRLKMSGKKFCLALHALSYHFVSKTSRFSQEYQDRTKSIEHNSHRNFIRKWRFNNISAIQKKYDVGFVLSHANIDLVRYIEPWCSCVYVDSDISDYIKEEQPRTPFDLVSRLKNKADIQQHDVMIYADGRRINEKALKKIAHLNEFVHKNINKRSNLFERFLSKVYEFRKWKILVRKHQSYEHQLIIRK